jgi:uncharacterized protein with GYD domain
LLSVQNALKLSSIRGTNRGSQTSTNRGKIMAKYLVKGNYVGEGIAGLLAEGGTSRGAAAAAAVASVGGTMEDLYFAFGDTDVYAICDLPDAASAAAVSLLINSSGNVQISLTPLLSAEDLDAASKKSPTYRAPGT